MTTITTIKAIDAYTEARHSMTESRAHTLVLGDTMADEAGTLVKDYDQLEGEYEAATSRECDEPSLHELDEEHLCELIRQEHDLHHDIPFAICAHRTCRAAAWLGQS